MRLVFAGVIAALLPASAHAAGTKTFRQTTIKDFEEGEAQGAQLLPLGDVVPGWKTSRVPADTGFVWSSTTSTDGGTAYFGTGDPGRIVALPVRGTGKEAVRKVADIDAPWVTSVVARKDGSLLAASTPGGRIFLVDASKGTSRELAKLPVEHVWTLVHDAKTGTTYAGTGMPGKVFAIDAQGKFRLHWDSGDKHVVSLADAGGGALFAGTSEDALLHRIGADGKSQVLHDFEADEVRAIVRAAGATFLAVNDFDRATGEAAKPATPQEAAAPKGTRVVTGGSSPPSAGVLPRPGQVKAKGAVYRLEDDGRIEQVFAIPDGYFTALLAAPSQDVFAAAGVDGKVYRVSPERTTVVALDLSERQALTLVRSETGVLVGTGDAGAIFRAQPAAGADALYLSKVLDAEQPSRWGQVRVTGSTDLRLETRSGVTAKPGASWTGWQPVEGLSFSGDLGEGRVASPGARYLQYRVVLPARTSVLREVSIYYLPQNLRGRVVEIGTDAAPAGAAKAHTPIVKLRWKVENPDGDELLYKLWFKQESEPVWRQLGPAEGVTKTELDWNTEHVPDGRYVVRVWATDARVVPADRALEDSLVSPPILVDNGKPELVGLTASLPTLSGRAQDEASPITAIDYTIDGGEWRPASPADGILDQRNEPFSLRLPQLPAGPHVVTVRASDSADNVGTARVVVTVK